MPDDSTGDELSAPAGSGAVERLIRIRASSGWARLELSEVWHHRELLYFLVWRDIKIRYKQTFLGIAWAVIQPTLTMIVFSIFFGRLAGVPSDGLPYPLFSFAGLVPWTLFAFGLAQSTASVVANQHLITKVYFPRLSLPIAAVLSGLVDFVLALLILFVLMIGYDVPLTVQAWWLPALTALAVVSALGVGFWLSALNVQYRDVRYALPFLTQLWMIATPIAYPSSLLGEPWRTLYALNPMAGVVEGFRWALLGAETQPGGMIAVSTCVTLAMLIGGAYYFRRMERTFADVV
jgi:lipopolysaccharide transport system permease protein